MKIIKISNVPEGAWDLGHIVYWTRCDKTASGT